MLKEDHHCGDLCQATGTVAQGFIFAKIKIDYFPLFPSQVS